LLAADCQRVSGGSNLNRITPWDVAVIGILILLGVYFLGIAGSGEAGGSTVVIKRFAGGSSTFDLRTDRIVEVEGNMGTTVISIENGSVRFISSCCPHGLCVKKGCVSRVGDWVACLPNGVLATVRGDAAYDGITP
jgi:hypothetical protein